MGLTLQSATATLQSDGLTATSTTTSSCGTADDGKVLSQDPAAGTPVRTSISVALTVCSPPAPMIMPNVVSMTEHHAMKILLGDGLTATSATTSSCGSFGNGIVVAQDPAAGTAIHKDTPIGISVCDTTGGPVP